MTAIWSTLQSAEHHKYMTCFIKASCRYVPMQLLIWFSNRLAAAVGTALCYHLASGQRPASPDIV